jgi:phage tail tape-measure protein
LLVVVEAVQDPLQHTVLVVVEQVVLENQKVNLSSPHTASPLAATTGLTVTATTYPVTVGGGGPGGPGCAQCQGVDGNNSVFSTITSTGGGGGGGSQYSPPGIKMNW